MYSIFIGVNVLFALTLTLWTALFIYSFVNIKENVVLFCFLISFFVFLLGRETVFAYFHVEPYYDYTRQVDNKTYIILFISIFMIAIGSILADKSNLNLSFKDVIVYPKSFPEIVKFVFYMTCTAAIFVTIQKIKVVLTVGYLASYKEGMEFESGIWSYFSSFCEIALCLFLACAPPKKECKKVILFYEIYLFLTLFTGLRNILIIGNLFVFSYVVIRHVREGNWIKKKHIFLLCVLLPFIVAFLYIYDFLRSGRNFNYTAFSKLIIGFLDQQGGSVNNIKRVMFYSDNLEDLQYTSLSGLKQNIFRNSVMRIFFDIKIYNGNSIEHALYGDSISHRLSYLVYKENYLNGRGTGSSYIAELYHDFGIFGVCIGNMLYGFLLKKISNIKLNGKISAGILLYFFFSLVYAPRSNFDYFLSTILSFSTAFGIVFIFVISNLYDKYFIIQREVKNE